MADRPGGLTAFTMPSLGADMDAGTIVDWYVAPGAEVHRGDLVARVETDKSDLDVEVFVDGVVRELVVPVGVRVPVGTVLATIEPHGSAPERSPEVRSPEVRSPEVGSPEVGSPDVRSPVLRSPVLRHLAEQLHVDLGRLEGSGPGGAITRDDIQAAGSRMQVSPRARRLAARSGIDLRTVQPGRSGVVTGDDVLRLASAPLVAPSTVPPRPTAAPAAAPVPVDTMRAAIARQMERAWREIPHFQVAQWIEVGGALTSLVAHNATRSSSDRVLAAAVLVRAAARAAARVPAVNGWWSDGALVPGDGVHLGVVVSLRQGGLVVPVIRHADQKDLDTVMGELRDLVTRARGARLRASELVGATFTVSQLGDGDVDTVVPIIHPPQRAILGLGGLRRIPWAVDDVVVVRPVVRATLVVDHRAVDGRDGSAYLLGLARILQEEPV